MISTTLTKVRKLAFAILLTGFVPAAQAASPVADAAARGDRTAVQALIAKKADVNAPQADGATALHWAVFKSDKELVDALIRAGANPSAANRAGSTPLWLACVNGDAAIIKALLVAGADPNEKLPLGRTPLMTASRTGNVEAMKVLKGGPVKTGHGFVLHSSDFFIENSTLAIDDGISLTPTLDILKAIAKGAGPQKAILALGYAGWAPGQLETEIQGNGWLHCPADPDLIFDNDVESKYERALRKIGIDLAMLSSEAGHA